MTSIIKVQNIQYTDGDAALTIADGGGVTAATTLAVTGDTSLKGNVVINEDSADKDFRVESDSSANALFVEGSSSNIGIGTASPNVIASNNTHVDIRSGTYSFLELGTTATTTSAEVGYVEFMNGNNNRLATIAGGSDGANNDGYMRFATLKGGSFTEQMRINHDGYVTKPNHPAFAAYIGSGGHGFVVGDTTAETIVFNSEHFDTTNSHSNGIFTAPVAGKYFFSSTISFYGTDTLRVHDFAWGWYKNDSAYTIQEIGNYIQESGVSEFNTLTLNIMMNLAASDNVRTKMYSFGSPYLSGTLNVPTGTRSNWSGYLIG